MRPSKPLGAAPLTAEEFAAAIEALIREAKEGGLSHDTLLVEIEDIANLLREGLL
jgi:hypothetical protein